MKSNPEPCPAIETSNHYLKFNHRAEHKLNHKPENKADHNLNHKPENKADHKQNHKPEQKSVHKLNHTHKPERRTDRKLNHKPDHNHKRTYLLLFAVLLLASSCGIFGSDDDSDDPMDRLSPDIREFVTNEMLAVFEDSLKIPVHAGENPPDIGMLLSGTQKIVPGDVAANALEAVVVMRPFVLLETVVPNDRCADDRCTYYDLYVRMSNQNATDNQIDIELRHAHQPEHGGTGAYIVGDDNRFSIFSEQVQEREEGRFVRSVILYSGIVTAGGIEDPHLGTIAVDNAGFEELIPVGTGQSHGDGNGFAEIADWPDDPEAKIAIDPSGEKVRTYMDFIQ